MNCENCGHFIERAKNGDGWTHHDVIRGWQGRRCPNRLSLAMPELVGVTHVCHRPDSSCNRHHSGAGDCFEGCQKEPMETIYITPTSPKVREMALDVVRAQARRELKP